MLGRTSTVADITEIMINAKHIIETNVDANTTSINTAACSEGELINTD